MKNNILLLLCLLIGIGSHAQKFDELAQTPPMGWNTWNKFACNVDEDLIKGAADAMVESGMKDAGHIVLEHVWAKQKLKLFRTTFLPKNFQ